VILLFLLINLTSDVQFDSLRERIKIQPEPDAIIAMNRYFQERAMLDSGIILLRKYEKILAPEKGIILIFHLAENYLFAGDIIQAREGYLKFISQTPDAGMANDALERLYLIEDVRPDTVFLKRFAAALRSYETEQYGKALDSLRMLLKGGKGYAYYFIALTYRRLGNEPMAYSALKELDTVFPEHRLPNACLLRAELAFELGNKKEAIRILEDLIIKMPQSVYAVRARQILKMSAD
jgi:tetratricopeptide (TPR) repeat protein